MNFKKAFSTVACMNYDAEKLKSLCEKYGFDAVEVRLDGEHYTHGDGLKIVDLGTSICVKRYSEEQVSEAKRILEKIENTDILAIRIFLGNFARRKTDKKDELDYDGIVRTIQKMCDLTKKQIWIETHNEFSTGKVLRKLLDDINRDNAKIIWDIIHPIEEGESPKETIDYIGKDIAHVHIKDGKPFDDENANDYFYTKLGEGVLPIKEILTLLDENHYNGYISLEWESLWRNEIKDEFLNVEGAIKMFNDFLEGLK